jgi:ribosomal protein L35
MVRAGGPSVLYERKHGIPRLRGGRQEQTLKSELLQKKLLSCILNLVIRPIIPSMSFSKALEKRVRITKNGKILRRAMAIDHFRTRKNATSIQKKRRMRSLDYPIRKIINY